MSWTNKSLKHLNQERQETKEIAEELYHPFMGYLPLSRREEFIQQYNNTRSSFFIGWVGRWQCL